MLSRSPPSPTADTVKNDAGVFTGLVSPPTSPNVSGKVNEHSAAPLLPVDIPGASLAAVKASGDDDALVPLSPQPSSLSDSSAASLASLSLSDDSDTVVYKGKKGKSTPEAIKSFRAKQPKLVEVRKFDSAEAKKRLIFIGDIHGCAREFDRLLKKASYKPSEDQVVLVGDLVAKGPDSIGVIRRARELNAWCVRGNHDDGVIRWREFLEGPGKNLSQNELKALERAHGLPYNDFKMSKPHYKIAKQMSPADFAFMSSFPTIMVLPPPFQDWLVVHGGLDPSKPLTQQDSHDVMNMRNIDSTGPISSHDKGLAWFELWSAKMKILRRERDANKGEAVEHEAALVDAEGQDIDHVHFSRVVYGHDANRNLQLHPYTKGLDTRCVYGGKLTAFILPGEKVVSVKCPLYEAPSNKNNHPRHHNNSNNNGNRRRGSNSGQPASDTNASQSPTRGKRNHRRRNSPPKADVPKQNSTPHSYSGAVGQYLPPVQTGSKPKDGAKKAPLPSATDTPLNKPQPPPSSRKPRNRKRSSSVF
ncbi:hypothetical protein FBU59_001558 [Linderina macrospora]|uniref:Uncharacterized protein n=1 Tax=Linderina macrospora TaxID=4868 RepID=A0ACC1JDM6_9FUNG|nr:hypothetical protein FBU59_001558 [Linderina macrospora]